MSNLHLLIIEMFLPFMPEIEAVEIADDLTQHCTTEAEYRFNIWDNLAGYCADDAKAWEMVDALLEEATAGRKQLAMAA